MDDENLIEKNVRMKADIAAYVNESIGVSIVSIHSQIFPLIKIIICSLIKYS